MDEEAAASDAGREEAEGSGLQLLAPAGAEDDGCGRPDASRTKGGGGTRRWCCSGSSLCSPEQGGGGIEGKLRGWFVRPGGVDGLDRGSRGRGRPGGASGGGEEDGWDSSLEIRVRSDYIGKVGLG